MCLFIDPKTQEEFKTSGPQNYGDKETNREKPDKGES